MAVVALIGMMLPQNHVAARMVRVRQTPEQVFAIISDVEKVVGVAGGCDAGRDTSVRQRPHDVSRTRQRRGHLSRRSVRPPRRRVVRIADTNLPYGGTWTYDVAPVASSAAPITQITITERGEVYNPIFRFMSRFVFSHYATIDAYLTALGKKLGESVTPETVSTHVAVRDPLRSAGAPGSASDRSVPR